LDEGVGQTSQRPAVAQRPHPADNPVSALEALLPAIRALDFLLERAIASAADAFGPGAATDEFRGLHLDQRECERLLQQEPGVPRLAAGPRGAHAWSPAEPGGGPLEELARTFGLSDFDVDVLLVALAPELDLRYERLYAYLQDDVTSRRPTVDLALNLLCSSREEKLVRRVHFGPGAPLLRTGLVELASDQAEGRPPLLSQALQVDPQVVRYLFGQPGLDLPLAAFCDLRQPPNPLSQAPVAEGTKTRLRMLLRDAMDREAPLFLRFRGPPGVGKRMTASGLASEAGARLLIADLATLPERDSFAATMRLLFRGALLSAAVLYLTGLDATEPGRGAVLRRCLTDREGPHPSVVVLAGADRLPALGAPMLTVEFPPPSFQRRRGCWRESLAAVRVAVADQDLDALAGRFRLTPGEVEAAVADARNRGRWRHAGDGDGDALGAAGGPDAGLTISDLFGAARAASGQELAALARKIEPKQSWPDLVLPEDQLRQLREICDQAAHRHTVYDAWGFGRRLSLGKGLNVLFAGPPGTGKTMAAEVIAGELQLDLYTIDLASVVSKYIGETEKNLARIFAVAERANAILLFDEADALYGKRSEVRDAHDRYANIEVGYLLQRMDDYEGIAVLATNLRQHLDEAFLRRMHAVVEFPMPGEDLRHRIWKVVFPREAPVDPLVDFALLARELKLAGGSIRNIAVTAAFHAAADGQVIRMEHLGRAARREYQKLGRTWGEPEWAR
jgi:AAA+ superfamily predicted ATPase